MALRVAHGDDARGEGVVGDAEFSGQGRGDEADAALGLKLAELDALQRVRSGGKRREREGRV